MTRPGRATGRRRLFITFNRAAAWRRSFTHRNRGNVGIFTLTLFIHNKAIDNLLAYAAGAPINVLNPEALKQA